MILPFLIAWLTTWMKWYSTRPSRAPYACGLPRSIEMVKHAVE